MKVSQQSSASLFPSIMQCDELMKLVQAGPDVLELCSIVQFPIFKQHAYSFADFLAELEQCVTIRSIRCNRHFTTGFSDEEWCRILHAFGIVRNLQELVFVDGGDSRLRRLNISVLADVILSAQRLKKLEFGKDWLLVGNDGHRLRFATALRNHTTLESFTYAGCGTQTQLYQSIAPRSSPSAILQALSTCKNLKTVHITNSPYCARDYTPNGLLQLVTSSGTAKGSQLRDLAIVTRPSNWRLVGTLFHECTLEQLVLTHSGREPCNFEDLTAFVLNLSQAPRLRRLKLRLCGPNSYFPRSCLEETERPQRFSEVLAEALGTNTPLRVLELSDCSGYGDCDTSTDTTYRPVKLQSDRKNPELYSFDDVDFNNLADAVCENGSVQVIVDVGLPNKRNPIRAAYNRLLVENVLNAAKRRSCVSNATGCHRDSSTLEALLAVSEISQHLDEGRIHQSCIYRLVRSNPLLCL